MRGLRSLLYFWHIARHCGIDLAMTTILACRATLIMSTCGDNIMSPSDEITTIEVVR